MSAIRRLGLGLFGTGGLAYYYSEYLTNNYIVPTLNKIDPETAHNITVNLLYFGIVPRVKKYESSALNVSIWGQTFENPVGLAAGFDKHAKAYKSLSKLGFGFVELGSVMLNPQEGNPKPRIFRTANTIYNTCGFNSDGLYVFYSRVLLRPNDIKLGINIGINKDNKTPNTDYITGILLLEHYSNYIVINISSPNTPGLRDLQQKDKIEELIKSIKSIKCDKPILFKLSPNLTDIELKDIVDLAIIHKVDGLVISNTIKLNGLEGGYSGKLLKEDANNMLKKTYKLSGGKIPIIGCGGIFNGEDAYERLKNGASLIQIYTSFTINGPKVIYKINRYLDKRLKEDGYTSISEAVGKNI
jgi:dihydroorotate dehydrogenase